MKGKKDLKRNTVVCLLVAIFLGLTTWSSSYGQERAQVRFTAAALGNKQVISYARLPLSFELNEGQVSHQARYLARGHGFTLFLTKDDAILQLQRSEETRQTGWIKSLGLSVGTPVGIIPPVRAESAEVVSLKLVGANPNAKIAAAGRLPGHTSYFLGNDPGRWHTNIPNFARVQYHEVYPGIDLAYHGHQGQLENDFLLAPGSDPHLIRLHT